MFDAIKTHETLWKLREKLGRYEKLCMRKMENFGGIENVETKQFWNGSNFGNVVLNDHYRIWILRGIFRKRE